jgi:hypothetical protein
MSIVEQGNRRIEVKVNLILKESKKITIKLLMEEYNDKFKELWV